MQGSSAIGVPLVRFSTEALQQPDQRHAVRDYLAAMMRVEVHSPRPDAPLSYAASLRSVPGASWGSARSSALTTVRSKAFLKDAAHDLLLVLPRSVMRIDQPGRDTFDVGPGEAALISQACECSITHFDDAHRAWALRVPHADIASLVPGLSSAPLLALRADTPGLALLRDYGRILERAPISGPLEQRMIARQVHDMVSLMIASSPDRREQAAGSIAAVRLATLDADIDRQLADPFYGLEQAAARQSVSPRQLQRLLAARGLQFTDVLRKARVDRAAALLADPRNRERSILSISQECGFSEPSAMNRAFRQELGLTPSEVRAG